MSVLMHFHNHSLGGQRFRHHARHMYHQFGHNYPGAHSSVWLHVWNRFCRSQTQRLLERRLLTGRQWQPQHLREVRAGLARGHRKGSWSAASLISTLCPITASVNVCVTTDVSTSYGLNADCPFASDGISCRLSLRYTTGMQKSWKLYRGKGGWEHSNIWSSPCDDISCYWGPSATRGIFP